jgi:hypothetical protein
MPELGDSLDLPYELNPPGQMLEEDMVVSGGLVAAGCTVPIDDEVKPAILFRFATPTGGFYPPMLLVLDDGQMAGLPKLVRAAATSSIEAARTANPRGRDV